MRFSFFDAIFCVSAPLFSQLYQFFLALPTYVTHNIWRDLSLGGGSAVVIRQFRPKPSLTHPCFASP